LLSSRHVVRVVSALAQLTPGVQDQATSTEELVGEARPVLALIARRVAIQGTRAEYEEIVADPGRLMGASHVPLVPHGRSG
jgi:hypothetical protein